LVCQAEPGRSGSLAELVGTGGRREARRQR
jgi:hypothetical protein